MYDRIFPLFTVIVVIIQLDYNVADQTTRSNPLHQVSTSVFTIDHQYGSGPGRDHDENNHQASDNHLTDDMKHTTLRSEKASEGDDDQEGRNRIEASILKPSIKVPDFFSKPTFSKDDQSSDSFGNFVTSMRVENDKRKGGHILRRKDERKGLYSDISVRDTAHDDAEKQLFGEADNNQDHDSSSFIRNSDVSNGHGGKVLKSTNYDELASRLKKLHKVSSARRLNPFNPQTTVKQDNPNKLTTREGVSIENLDTPKDEHGGHHKDPNAHDVSEKLEKLIRSGLFVDHLFLFRKHHLLGKALPIKLLLEREILRLPSSETNLSDKVKWRQTWHVGTSPFLAPRIKLIELMSRYLEHEIHSLQKKSPLFRLLEYASLSRQKYRLLNQYAHHIKRVQVLVLSDFKSYDQRKREIRAETKKVFAILKAYVKTLIKMKATLIEINRYSLNIGIPEKKTSGKSLWGHGIWNFLCGAFHGFTSCFGIIGRKILDSVKSFHQPIQSPKPMPFQSDKHVKTSQKSVSGKNMGSTLDRKLSAVDRNYHLPKELIYKILYAKYGRFPINTIFHDRKRTYIKSLSKHFKVHMTDSKMNTVDSEHGSKFLDFLGEIMKHLHVAENGTVTHIGISTIRENAQEAQSEVKTSPIKIRSKRGNVRQLLHALIRIKLLRDRQMRNQQALHSQFSKEDNARVLKDHRAFHNGPQTVQVRPCQFIELHEKRKHVHASAEDVSDRDQIMNNHDGKRKNQYLVNFSEVSHDNNDEPRQNHEITKHGDDSDDDAKILESKDNDDDNDDKDSDDNARKHDRRDDEHDNEDDAKKHQSKDDHDDIDDDSRKYESKDNDDDSHNDAKKHEQTKLMNLLNLVHYKARPFIVRLVRIHNIDRAQIAKHNFSQNDLTAIGHNQSKLANLVEQIAKRHHYRLRRPAARIRVISKWFTPRLLRLSDSKVHDHRDISQSKIAYLNSIERLLYRLLHGSHAHLKSVSDDHAKMENGKDSNKVGRKRKNEEGVEHKQDLNISEIHHHPIIDLSERKADGNKNNSDNQSANNESETHSVSGGLMGTNRKDLTIDHAISEAVENKTIHNQNDVVNKSSRDEEKSRKMFTLGYNTSDTTNKSNENVSNEGHDRLRRIRRRISFESSVEKIFERRGSHDPILDADRITDFATKWINLRQRIREIQRGIKEGVDEYEKVNKQINRLLGKGDELIQKHVKLHSNKAISKLKRAEALSSSHRALSKFTETMNMEEKQHRVGILVAMEDGIDKELCKINEILERQESKQDALDKTGSELETNLGSFMERNDLYTEIIDSDHKGAVQKHHMDLTTDEDTYKAISKNAKNLNRVNPFVDMGKKDHVLGKVDRMLNKILRRSERSIETPGDVKGQSVDGDADTSNSKSEYNVERRIHMKVTSKKSGSNVQKSNSIDFIIKSDYHDGDIHGKSKSVQGIENKPHLDESNPHQNSLMNGVAESTDKVVDDEKVNEHHFSKHNYIDKFDTPSKEDSPLVFDKNAIPVHTLSMPHISNTETVVHNTKTKKSLPEHFDHIKRNETPDSLPKKRMGNKPPFYKITSVHREAIINNSTASHLIPSWYDVSSDSTNSSATNNEMKSKLNSQKSNSTKNSQSHDHLAKIVQMRILNSNPQNHRSKRIVLPHHIRKRSAGGFGDGMGGGGNKKTSFLIHMMEHKGDADQNQQQQQDPFADMGGGKEGQSKPKKMLMINLNDEVDKLKKDKPVSNPDVKLIEEIAGGGPNNISLDDINKWLEKTKNMPSKKGSLQQVKEALENQEDVDDILEHLDTAKNRLKSSLAEESLRRAKSLHNEITRKIRQGVDYDQYVRQKEEEERKQKLKDQRTLRQLRKEMALQRREKLKQLRLDERRLRKAIKTHERRMKRTTTPKPMKTKHRYLKIGQIMGEPSSESVKSYLTQEKTNLMRMKLREQEKYDGYMERKKAGEQHKDGESNLKELTGDDAGMLWFADV